MRLEQFDFKKSLTISYDDEAKLHTGKGHIVTIFRKKARIVVEQVEVEKNKFEEQKVQKYIYKLVKNIHGRDVYNVTFVKVSQLVKALKNIGKRK